MIPYEKDAGYEAARRLDEVTSVCITLMIPSVNICSTLRSHSASGRKESRYNWNIVGDLDNRIGYLAVLVAVLYAPVHDTSRGQLEEWMEVGQFSSEFLASNLALSWYGF